MPDQEISFAQLVALMAVGEGRDRSMRGVVRHREAEPVDDDEPADLEVPGDGRYRHQEEHIRVLMRGELARREQLDGRLLAIQGPETLWVWEEGEDEPTAFPRRTTAWGWPDSVLTQRRELDEWRGDDFTRPAAAPVSTTFLGRSAWQVELLPPPHKLFPLVLTVDAETGLVLSDRNEGFDSVTEWTELELDVDLSDELFEWDGPSHPPRDHRAEHDLEMARRARWLADQGVGQLELKLPVEVMLHENATDGSFQASLQADFHGSLARRRHSDEPWDLFMNWPHMHRWTDGGWDWWLGTPNGLDATRLHELKSWLVPETDSNT
jgi:hypothetical protein